MKYLFFYITLCYSFSANAQFFDDFSDLELYNNPSWHGDITHFSLEDEKLNLNADSAGTSLLYTSLDLSSLNEYEWSFDLSLDFSPSNNNYINLLLLSLDSLLLDSNDHDVIYFHVGENGSNDAIELYHYSTLLNEHILICRGEEGSVASAFSNHYRIVYHSGEWSIESRELDSPYLFQETNAFYDPGALIEGFFSMNFTYTSSNTDAIQLDQIYAGEYLLDETPPSIDSIKVDNELTLSIYFSESIDSSALISSNYLLYPSLLSPQSVVFANPLQTKVELVFNEAFIPWENYSLSIDSLSDIAGNSEASLNNNFVFSALYIGSYGDLRFSEILPDPTPSVTLPEAEYIEIFNSSDSIIQLENYKIINSGVEMILSSFELMPDSFLILCKASELSLFIEYGSVMGISNWQSLLNSGDSLILRNIKDDLLDVLYYSDEWYVDELKAEGGWSLERIDYLSDCLGKVNWSECQDIHGGSPGKTNSNFGGEIINELLFEQAYLIDESHFHIEYKGEIDSSRFEESELVSDPQMLLDWQTFEISSDGITLSFSPSFGFDEERFIKINDLYSCNNILIPEWNFALSIPKVAEKGDVVINEILFNAFSGAHDFIEIYNKSQKYIDLKNWRIIELYGGLPVEDARISNNTLMIAPGQIMAFSEEPYELPLLYPYNDLLRIKEVKDLPSFSDNDGEIHLLNNDLLLIDSMYFSKDMHFSLLEDENGVSLERLHPDKASMDDASWISASESVGFATPGVKNSHFLHQVYQGKVYLEPKIISPNNDGIDDMLQVHYQFEKSGWLGKMIVYNDRGELVSKVISDFWMSQKGSLIWNGFNDRDERVGLGIYIVFLEVFNEDGERYRFKKPFVVE